MISIQSYSTVNGLEFGASEKDILACFGEPQQQWSNRSDGKDLHFDGFILRIGSPSMVLRECTLLPRCEAVINGMLVVWDDAFLAWLAAEDADLKTALGFIVSYRLGIAVSGFHDGDKAGKAIHAFGKGNWDQFVDRMAPYVQVG